MITLVLCSGCLNGRYDPNLSIGEQIKTRHYDHNAKDFGKNELLDEILDASYEQDSDRILELFSDHALEEDENLEDEITLYLESFPEDIDELYNRGCSEFGSHNRGSSEYFYLYQPVVWIKCDNGDVYLLEVIWIEGDSENPERQGIHSIQLISMKAYEDNDYTIHREDDRPGVYVYE